MSTPGTHSITDKQAVEAVVIVRGAADGFAQEVVAGLHHFRTDEPAAVGGTDSDPTFRSAVGRTWVPYFHDRCNVCAAKEVAAGAGHGAPSSFASSR